MKKLVFIIAMMLGMAAVPAFGQTEIEMGIVNDNPTSGNGDYPRGPIRPVVTQYDHELTLPAFSDNVTLCLFDDDELVYSVYVPAGTTLVVLPATLTGEFEIRFVADTYYYYGFIEL